MNFLINYVGLFRNKINQILSYSVLFYIFIFPFSHYYSNKLIDILFIFWILSIDLNKLILILKKSLLFKLILLMSLIILISYFWSEPNNTYYGNFAQYGKAFLNYFIYPYLILSTTLKKENYYKYVFIFLSAVLVNVLLSYGIFFQLINSQSDYYSYLNPIVFHTNHITYSTLIGFSLLILIYFIVTIKDRKKRIIFLIISSFLLINLFINFGRTGQFSFILTFLFLLIYYQRKKILHIMIGISFLIIFIIIFLYTNKTFNYRINSVINDVTLVLENKEYDSSFGTRIMAYSIVPYMDKKDLLFGVGVGDKNTYVKKIANSKEYPYKLKNFEKFGYLHNHYVELLVSNGIFVLLLYLFMIIYLIFKTTSNSFFRYFNISTGIYFFCVGLTTDIFFFYEIMLLYSFCLSLSTIFFLNEDYNEN